MRPLVCAACLLALAAAGPAVAGSDDPRLFIQGCGRFGDKIDPIWIARVERNQAGVEQTIVLLREKFGDTDYQQFDPFLARAVAVTGDSTELVMLLANRQWVWFSTARCSYGPLLPDEPRGEGLPEETRILTLAGSRKSLWALGEPNFNTARPVVPKTMPAGTRPAVQTAQPRVYLLDGDRWKRQPASWPAGTTPSQWARVSMAVVGDLPCIGIPQGGQDVAFYRLTPSGQAWESLGVAKCDKPVTRLKMLDMGGVPGGWLFDEQGMGRIWTASGQFLLEFEGPVPQPTDVDLAVAGSVIRCVFLRDNGNPKIFEQRYSLTGARDGKPKELTYKANEPTFNWLATVALSAAALLLVTTFLRRHSDVPSDGDEEE